MERREFLRSGAAVTVATAVGGLPRVSRAASTGSDGAKWRTFEVVTRVEVASPTGPTRVWLPMPLAVDTDYQKSLGRSWTGNAAVARVYRDDKYRESSRLVRTDGIVKKTSQQITKGADKDVEKARAIYEWIVENTFRDPKVRGCGVGDIRAMLETGNLGGKCADLNALFVGLARAAGIPARDVYGVRAADSAEFKSLGKSGEITKAQHCRAEFYVASHGWVPVDPADVRKVVLEERRGIPLDDPTTQKARVKLFGQWEMNWLAYNYAHDMKLLNSKGDPVDYFMYPQAETGEARKDSLDPDSFKYKITSRELGI
jgi:transglutaminase-like putative cysteine protease